MSTDFDVTSMKPTLVRFFLTFRSITIRGLFFFNLLGSLNLLSTYFFDHAFRTDTESGNFSTLY